MNVRWRILHGAFDQEEYERVLEKLRAGQPGVVGRIVEWAIDPNGPSIEQRASSGLPLKVTPEDGSGTLDDVRALLAAGRLRPSDLIDTGEGWSTIEQCPLLDDEETGATRAAQRQRLARMVIVVAATLAVIAFMILAMARRH